MIKSVQTSFSFVEKFWFRFFRVGAKVELLCNGATSIRFEASLLDYSGPRHPWWLLSQRGQLWWFKKTFSGEFNEELLGPKDFVISGWTNWNSCGQNKFWQDSTQRPLGLSVLNEWLDLTVTRISPSNLAQPLIGCYNGNSKPFKFSWIIWVTLYY